ncbi:unnamed protein product [Gemmataceae bacterium]|nr:unnamed protein product [Gemmataceae bacterium]VTT99928.1 unnamed protein product [Gemmataceae bacterium]
MLGRFARSAATFHDRDTGPTAVEYTVMIAMILMTVLTAISAMEQTLAGS